MVFGLGSSQKEPAVSQPPNRTKRAQCWEARDSFFRCLDRNDIVDSIKEAGKAGTMCKKENEAFEKECVASWVEYFKKRRTMEHKREKMLENLQKEGAETMSPPPPNPIGKAQMEEKKR